MCEFPFDVGRYLSRIGAERPAELTAASLQKLVRAHLEQVPFEVLELTEEKTQPSMEPQGLYEKIVVRKRGGYCFELNKLFYLLLRELGYTCYCVGVRCIIGRPEEEGHYVVVYLDSGDRPVRMLKFRDEAYLDVDFNMLNGYYSVHPKSPFRAKRILYRCLDDGWISFVGTTYTVFRKGQYTTEEITDEAAQRRLIQTKFDLNIPYWEM